jgi:hypothetical protein
VGSANGKFQTDDEETAKSANAALVRCQLSVVGFPFSIARGASRLQWRSAPSCRAHRLKGVADAKQHRLVEMPPHDLEADGQAARGEAAGHG